MTQTLIVNSSTPQKNRVFYWPARDTLIYPSAKCFVLSQNYKVTNAFLETAYHLRRQVKSV